MKNILTGRRWLPALLVILLMAGVLWGCATTSSTYSADAESESWWDEEKAGNFEAGGYGGWGYGYGYHGFYGGFGFGGFGRGRCD